MAQSFSAKYYYVLAVLSGISFAFHNLFFYSQASLDDEEVKNLGFAVLIPYWIGELPPIAIFLIYQCFKERNRTGSFWSRAESKYFEIVPGTGDEPKVALNRSIEGDDAVEAASAPRYQLRWFNVVGLIWRTFLIFSGQCLFLTVLQFTAASGANLAVITSMFTLAAFFTAFVFQFMFNEQLQLKHYIGMVFLGCAVIVISQSQQMEIDAGNTDDPSVEVQELMPIIWPILFVAITAVNHTCITVTARYWMLHGGLESFDLSVDSFFWHLIILAIGHLIYSLAVNPIPGSVILYVALGAFFNMAGFFLVAEACSYGKAGPAQALMELQSIWQLTLEMIIYQKYPNFLQVIGMSCALVGAFVVAYERGGKKAIDADEAAVSKEAKLQQANEKLMTGYDTLEADAKADEGRARGQSDQL